MDEVTRYIELTDRLRKWADNPSAIESIQIKGDFPGFNFFYKRQPPNEMLPDVLEIIKALMSVPPEQARILLMQLRNQIAKGV